MSIEPTVALAVRGALDCANNVMMWIRRAQRVDPGPRPVRVNLGSALAVAPEWIHIDASPNAFLAGRSGRVQAIAYRFTGSNAYFELEEYRRRLNEYSVHPPRPGVLAYPFAPVASTSCTRRTFSST
jgi:hypothetical protein